MTAPMPYGLRYPNGTIMQNGDRSQEWDNMRMNQDTYMSYLFRMLDITMSIFEWYGLPKGIDARMLEWWLLRDGVVALFKDDSLKTDKFSRAPEGYAVLPVVAMGELDMYELPRTREAYSVNGLNVELNEENSILIFNDYLRVPMLRTIELYATRLANVERTIDVNVMNQKSPKVIRCDEKQRLTFKNLMMQVEGNEYKLWADKTVNLDDIAVLDLSVPFLGSDLTALKKQYWGDFLTYVGVQNFESAKKERLVSGEVTSSMGDIEAQRFTRLNPRKQACEEAKELWGLEMDVEFRADFNMRYTNVQPKDLMDENGKTVDSESDEGIIERIKKAIGMQ